MTSTEKKRIAITITLSSLFLLTATATAQGITIPSNTGLPEPATNYTNKGPVAEVILYFMEWILMVFVVLAVISFVVTGIQYILALGNSNSAENAKKNFVYSIIAVAITASAVILINTIDSLLSA